MSAERLQLRELFGQAFSGLLVFAYQIAGERAPLPAERLFTFRERLYGFLGIRLNEYDVKYLVRAICNSEAYQRTSRSEKESEGVDPDLTIHWGAYLDHRSGLPPWPMEGKPAQEVIAFYEKVRLALDERIDALRRESP